MQQEPNSLMPQSYASPQRIAYVMKRYPRFSETFIVNEILAHEAAGVEVHIFSSRLTDDPHFQPVICQVRAPVTYLDAESRADAFWSVLKRLASHSPDVWATLALADKTSSGDVYQGACLALEVIARGIDHIHAHFATGAAAITRMASLFTGVPYTLTAHARDIFHESVDQAQLAQKLASAATVVTVSDFNVRFLSERFEESAHRVRRVYNGLDLQHFDFVRPERRPRKILAVGRLVEKKGFDDLVRACRMLVDWGARFQCEIVGGGECHDALRQQIEAMDLCDVVDLVGPRPLTYVKQAMREAAVFAVPCVTASTGDRDGLPTVMLESMALGTPVVATSVTGIPEVVQHERTGLLLEERRPEEFAAALKRMLDDPELGARMAVAARDVIEQDFDIHRNAAKLREVFAACHRPAAPALTLAEVG
jgi:colanic acid/amylovoran biosynthesis glycosyltransferase